jgi:hypothetical protein
LGATLVAHNVREKNALINGPLMRQKAEELAKTVGKEKFSATDGWFNKNRENIVYKRMRGAEKSADFLAADEWIKRKWPKIIAEYSPEDTSQTKQDSIFVLFLSILICLKMKVLNDLNLRKSE